MRTAEADPEGAAAADLATRFTGTLEFGTAGPARCPRRRPHPDEPGRRDPSGSRTRGVPPGERRRRGDRVVIGYDARHNSDVFAQDTAEVMTGAGLQALLLPRPLPTPLLAYAIRHLGCVAGVMVTASHNPPQDNGYKVYLGDGSQIVPPADTEIAAPDRRGRGPRRRAAGRRPERCSATTSSTPTWTRSPRCPPRTDPATCAWSTPRCTASAATRRRGAGASRFRRTARGHRAGRARPGLPDRRFPNPEEPGAMDLAMALAEQVGADLVIANDPDADRLRRGASPTTDGWRMLRGDEVGALLGRLPAARGRARHLRDLDRVVVAARQDGAATRAALRRNADRLQVDRPGGRPRVRLRGGARLLRRPRPGAGQGRRLGRHATSSSSPRSSRPRAAPCMDRLDEIAEEYGAARHRPALACGSTTCRDRGGDGPAPVTPADSRWAGSRSSATRTSPGQRGAAADRRAALPAGRRRPGGRAAVGHGAEDQVLPRGRGPGRRHGAGRRGRRPHRRRSRLDAIRMGPGARRRALTAVRRAARRAARR